MTIMRHEDLVPPASSNLDAIPARDYRTAKRYLTGAGIRIALLCLTVGLLIAGSV